MRKILGVMLAGLTVGSAVLAIGGIWGWIEGQTAWQLIITFMVVGLSTMGLSHVADTFFGTKAK